MRPRGMSDVNAAKDSSTRQRGPNGVTRVRGLRDLIVAEDVQGRTVPTTHAQKLSELNWLEREAERLQREADIMEANLRRIHSRLAEIDERRQMILELVREGLGLLGVDPAQPSARSASETSAHDSSGFETVSIDY